MDSEFKIAERPIKSKVIEAVKQQRKNKFVKVPFEWMDRLNRARHASTFKVALALLHRRWKTSSNTVLLQNTGLGFAGVSRRQKWRALAELERLGLIAIERRVRKSPRVTVLDPH
jgi:hypothetical protein